MLETRARAVVCIQSQCAGRILSCSFLVHLCSGFSGSDLQQERQMHKLDNCKEIPKYTTQMGFLTQNKVSVRKKLYTDIDVCKKKLK